MFTFRDGSPSPREVAVTKKKKTTTEEKAQEVVPKTPYDMVADKNPELLNTAATARKHAINLNGLDYAGELSKQLLDLAVSMENLFKVCQEKLKKEKDEKVFKKLLKEMHEKDAFWEKAKAGCILLIKSGYVQYHFISTIITFVVL